MSHIARITLIGLYNYDSSLFDNLQLPDGVDKETFINSLLLEHGEKPVIYTNPDFMKFAIGVWSNKYYDSFTKIVEALTSEYNPIHNSDRYEEIFENRKNNTENSGTDTTTTTLNSETESSGSNESSNENQVSAYNQSDYTPDNKSDTDSSFTNSGSDNQHGSSEIEHGHRINTDDNFTRSAHLYGNIGITTSQEMVTAEIDLRMKYNVYTVIGNLFTDEFLLYLY